MGDVPGRTRPWPRSRRFLERLYPRLVAWHDWLLTARDLRGRGLVSVVHPWESGMDNSPAWDLPLSRVVPLPPAELARRDLAHAAASERPTDADYGRYIRLARDYRDSAVRRDARVRGRGPAVQRAAARPASTRWPRSPARSARTRHRHLVRAQQVTDALMTELWDAGAGTFFAVRRASVTRCCGRTRSRGLLPLVVPDLPVATDLVKTALGDRFRLADACPLPSYDLTAGDHEPGRYWRGPGWINTSWLFWHGLRLHGETSLADDLRDRLLARVRACGFREYVDPLTGAGYGTDDFSWTAALTLDLIRTGPRR